MYNRLKTCEIITHDRLGIYSHKTTPLFVNSNIQLSDTIKISISNNNIITICHKHF